MKYKKSYFLIGQKAIVTNQANELLLLRRSNKTPAPGRWDFPGGGLDQGEDAIKGIKREIKEEAGLTIIDITPIKFTTHLENKDSVLLIIYWALAKSNKVKLSWEHDEYVWVNKKTALTMKLPALMNQVIKSIL